MELSEREGESVESKDKGEEEEDNSATRNNNNQQKGRSRNTETFQSRVWIGPLGRGLAGPPVVETVWTPSSLVGCLALTKRTPCLLETTRRRQQLVGTPRIMHKIKLFHPSSIYILGRRAPAGSAAGSIIITFRLP